MSEQTDIELIQLTLTGERDAFGLLFERYWSMAQNVAYGIVHDRAVAEDLAQDAMLQAYLSLDNLKDHTRYSSWLHGIVRNVCHSYLRRQNNVAAFGGDSMDGWRFTTDSYMAAAQFHCDPVQAAERQMHQSAVHRAIGQLPPKRKEAAALFYLEQMSVREIAQALGASETAIKSRLFQARTQLQVQLAPLFIDVNDLALGGPAQNDRNGKMIKIDAVHAFEQGDGKYTVACFLAKDALRYLPMWIGIGEGHTLERIINGEETHRPLTHSTMAKMLELLDAKVTSVEVNALKDTTFYGIIHIECNGTTKQLDARPSDAIMLALIADAPIYVANEVMEMSGEDLPSPFDEAKWLEATKAKRLAQAQLVEKWKESLATDGATLTTRAQQACTRMMAEAIRYNHSYVGTEHLLLGLVAEHGSVAREVLTSLGVTYTTVDKLMGEMVSSSKSPPSGTPTIVSRLTKVFELAEAERAQRGHTYIGSEHLLLGLIAEGQSEESDQQGMAMQFLEKLGVNGDDVKQRIKAVFNDDG